MRRGVAVSKPIIGYAGLTHLGLNLAAATADKGFKVIGYHNNSKYVSSIKKGNLPVTEPGLDDLIKTNKRMLNFSDNINALRECDIIYVSIDVPTDQYGNSNLTQIYEMVSSIQSRIEKDTIMVISCQVPPGFTRKIKWPAAYLYYQVETLVFGQAVERAKNPERFILGCSKPEKKINPRLKEYLSSFKCPVLPMRYESAELAKISINMCLVASLSVANTMAEICEKIGADWSEIIPSLKLDKRIGAFSYLKPGLGIGGGNLERDLNTVVQMSENHQTDGNIVRAWINNSSHRKVWVWEKLNENDLISDPDMRIGILGLTYKENTHSTKNSPALALLKELEMYKVCVHDPVISINQLGMSFSTAKCPEDVAIEADALAIMTPWPEYAHLNLNVIASLMRGSLIIDPYAILDEKTAIKHGFNYITLGRSKLPIQKNGKK